MVESEKTDAYEMVEEKGYDIEDNVGWLEKFYIHTVF